MTAIIAVTVMVVPASAESLEKKSTEIKSGQKINRTFYSSSAEAYYKINVSEAGELKISFNNTIELMFVAVYDSLGNGIGPSDYKATIGTIENPYYSNKERHLRWKSNVEKEEAFFIYNVSAGTYYIEIQPWYLGKGELNMIADFPSNDTPAPKSIQLKITLNVGDTLRLGAIIDPEDAEAVTYSSSKKSVATVSKTGKVKAVAKGSTIIKLKSGQKALKIKIIVV